MAQSERREKVVKLEPPLRFSRVAPGVAKAKLRDETRRVLIALGIFVNANGQCWPGNSLLSTESRVDRRHLWRAFREASEKGFLTIERRGDGGNLYTLIGLAPIAMHGDAVSPGMATGVAPYGDAVSPGMATGVAPYGDTHIEEHPNEHPKGAAHSTARARACESAVEILSPIEVERADRFELLWAEYPSRPDDSKRLARQAFDELVSAGVHADHLIAAASRYGEWVRRDEPGGAYAPHLHRWLRDGRYHHDGKSWPRPRQGIVGIARDFIENSPLARERQHETGPSERRVFWIDRLDELERTGIWPADWGPGPDDPACELPPKFRGKPCVSDGSSIGRTNARGDRRSSATGARGRGVKSLQPWGVRTAQGVSTKNPEIK